MRLADTADEPAEAVQEACEARLMDKKKQIVIKRLHRHF